MADLEQYIMAEGSAKFREAKHLTDVLAKSDPETEPYKSMYEARQIWAELKSNLERLEADDVLYKARKAVVHYYVGVNFIECEETNSGEEHLRQSIELVESCGINELTCNVLQHVYNYMGVLWSGLRTPQKAMDYLQKAEKLYHDYKHEVGSPPYCVDELMDSWTEDEKVQKRMIAFEEAFTKTTYYMAQIFTALERNDEAAKYCQFTLKRQLESTYDPVEWALNCATLSQYHLGVNNAATRHFLSSASLVLSQVDEESDKLARSRADINRCWGKYVLNLLEKSKVRLFEDLDELPRSEPASTDVDRFDLECDRYEAEVTDQYLNVYAEARLVFLFGQRKLNESLNFYTLSHFATDHVEIQQDISKLFKGLAFFDEDMERQCKMQKRRIDILSPLLEQLNMQFYLLICRQLMFEIAEIYSEMVDLKLALVEDKRQPINVHQAKKLNHLITESIRHYDKYSKSFNNPDGKIPDDCDGSDYRPLLIAKFCTARLVNKIVVTNAEDKCRNLQESIDRYQAVVDYCERHEVAAQSVKTELELCKEMVQLLPVKLDRISRDGLNAV